MKITEQVRQDIKDMAAAFDRGETLDRKEVILQKQKREGQTKDAWVFFMGRSRRNYSLFEVLMNRITVAIELS